MCKCIMVKIGEGRKKPNLGKSLESIGRAEEVSLQFRAKGSLSEGIVDMRG